MDAIILAIESVTDVVGEIFTLMTSNAYLTFFMAVGLIGVGVGVFSMLKRAAH